VAAFNILLLVNLANLSFSQSHNGDLQAKVTRSLAKSSSTDGRLCFLFL